MSFLNELKQRRVPRVALVYGAAGFAVIQVADVIFPRIPLPDWTVSLVVWLTILGFPIALAMAWVFQITPDGLVRSSEVKPSGASSWITARTLIVTVLLIAIAAAGGWIAGGGLRSDTEAARLRSVAVLPFVDMTPEKNMEYFGDGMAEEILNALTGVSELKVAGRTSSFSFKGKDADLKAIGAALGVATILEGSIRRSGAELRVTAQLVRADDQSHLWSNVFKYDSGRDVFEIQDDISRAVVAALRLNLTGDPGAKLSERGTENAEAYDAFIRGKAEWNRRTSGMARASIRSFQRALELDPNFARAHSALADAYIFAANAEVLPSDEGLGLARQSIQRALAIDSTLADAHISLGSLNIFELEFDSAERAFRRGIGLNPSHAYGHFWYSQLLDMMNRPDSALAELLRARDLDPLATRIAAGIGDHYLLSGQYERSRQEYQRVLEDDPEFEMVRPFLALSYTFGGMPDSALKVMEQVSDPGENFSTMFAYAALDRRAAVLEAIARDTIAPGATPDYTSIALLYARLGDLDHAFRWFDHAASIRDPGLRHIGPCGRVIPELSADLRWVPLLKRIGLDRYWNTTAR